MNTFRGIELPPELLLDCAKTAIKKFAHKRPNLPVSLQEAVNFIRASSKITVLSGAGISVSCGIPDFRSSSGLYARIRDDFPELDDPQLMFDINYFSADPRPFFRVAKDIVPANFTPSPTHMFIRQLEIEGRLLRNYTQNIDTLEQSAGIENVIYCHGSFASAQCVKCGLTVPGESIHDQIMAEVNSIYSLAGTNNDLIHC